MGKFYLVLLVFAFISAKSVAAPAPELFAPGPIRAAAPCILKIIATHMNIELKSEIAAPTLRLQGETSLVYFQDRMADWWKFRPDMFANVYTPLSGEIFLMLEKQYYNRFKRSPFDSLAHELVHFLQVQYLKFDLAADPMAAEAAESQAVAEQTWFREAFEPQKSTVFPCAASHQ